jgi:hypothetical protein
VSTISLNLIIFLNIYKVKITELKPKLSNLSFVNATADDCKGSGQINQFNKHIHTYIHTCSVQIMKRDLLE